MLSGKQRVLEIGCADAFGTRIVQQEVKHIVATDFDPLFIQDAKSRMDHHWPLDVLQHDIIHDGPVKGSYDAAYCLDVIEHISPDDENRFIQNVESSLTEDGVFIIGTPSLESQKYASPQSKEGHINCKSGSELKTTMLRYFQNVFVFSMNDEVIHTGYLKMAHYLFAVCCGKRLSR
jgi:2-polyprenyl-3-methyl-5-hydroxy-6-metoxy-1,4-benzoquinol methylase